MDNPEFQLLESIYAATKEGSDPAPVTQRDLANSAGLSLGLTNTLLKRFIERGYVKLLHANGRKLMYALTPMGVEEIASRTIDYFARAAKNTSLYRKKIDSFIAKLAERGYRAVLLLGHADIDFLVEYACLKHGIQFYKSTKAYVQECAQSGNSYRELLVIWAGEAQDAVSNAEIKKSAGLPESIPLIKFSSILMDVEVHGVA